MMEIPNDFLDELIYKNYEDRLRSSFSLDPRPDKLTALYAEVLHVTLADRKLGSANTACSIEPYSMIGNEDDLLIAVAILVSQGKIIVNKPVETYKRRRAGYSSLTGQPLFPLDSIKVLWVEAVSSDAYWRAWRKALVITQRWSAKQDIKKALDQIAIWEKGRREAENMLHAWEQRLKADEQTLASLPIHPHLMDVDDESVVDIGT